MPTAADILDQHVTFQLRCVDRLFLHGYVPLLQTPGGIELFLGRDGPIRSPALFQRRSDGFRAALEAYAREHAAEWIHFVRKERKEERVRPLFERAEHEGRTGLVAVGVAQERMSAWQGRKHVSARGSVSFEWTRRSVHVNHYYLYLFDAEWGRSFIKIAGYAPWGIHLWLNGHDWLKRQLARRGIAYRALDNGLLACDDPASAQRLASALGPAEVKRYLARWLAVLPQPLTPADRAAGHGYALSMLQTEVSDTRVFDRPLRGRQWFEAQLPELLATGRPERIGLLFARQVRRTTPGRFETELITPHTVPAIRFRYKQATVKQYLKMGRALRTETTFGDPYDVEVGRRIDNLPKLIAKGHEINARVLELERATETARLDGPEITALTRPGRDARGRRVAGLRLGDLRVMALLAALVAIVSRHLAAGFSNAQLRRTVAELLALSLEEYTSAKMTYDLGRLMGHGLIARLPGTRRYRLTPFGLRAAAFLTKLADRVLDPGIARCASPPRSPERSIWRRLECALDDLLDHARLAA